MQRVEELQGDFFVCHHAVLPPLSKVVQRIGVQRPHVAPLLQEEVQKAGSLILQGRQHGAA